MTPSVSIVGAGLGGLTLARVLQVHGITSQVYDLEPSRSSRTQGGQIDLHEDSGQRALAIAGLDDEFAGIVHQGAAAARVADRHDTTLAELPDEANADKPEALRGDIRRILLDSLPPETLRWGRKLTAVEADGTGGHLLSFADGTTEHAAVLVGADGVFSRVRPLLSEAWPRYSGMTYVDTHLDDVDERHAAAARAVGAGALYALEPGRGFLAHREAGDRIHTYLVLDHPPEWFDRLDLADPAGTRARLAAEFDGWAPALRSLIADSDTDPIVRAIHELPDDHRWTSRPGVTLLGDAAHATVPGGNGANTAMLDGAELGLALAQHPDDPDAAIAEYEPTMFRRAAESAATAHEDVAMIFGPGSPHRLAAVFRGEELEDA